MKKNRYIIMLITIILISTNASCIYGYENNDLIPKGQFIYMKCESRYPFVKEVGNKIGNKLEVSDVIVSLNEINLDQKDMKYVSSLVDAASGNLKLTIIRKDKVKNISISSKSLRKCVLHNTIDGFGTITAMDSNGKFYALSHNIHANGNTLNIYKGEVYETKSVEQVKSKGENVGYLYSNDTGKKIGYITKNSEYGIKGEYIKGAFSSKDFLEIGDPVVGEAWILCGSPSSNEMKYCKINILEVNDCVSKIEVLDEELINYRGGIAQGMSGSPIIQNNKIVGGVRAVYTNNTKIGIMSNIDSILEHLDDNLK